MTKICENSQRHEALSPCLVMALRASWILVSCFLNKILDPYISTIFFPNHLLYDQLTPKTCRKIIFSFAIN